jgi:protein-tyrosine phosphatase
MNQFLSELRRIWTRLRVQGIRVTLEAGLDKIIRFVTGRSPWVYSRITPEILLGGQPARHSLVSLVAAGVTGVINMRDEYDYEEEIGNLELDYLYLPTIDHTAPSLINLERGVTFIKGQVARDGSVYIHCWGGVGRGPSMVAAYFISQGMTVEEAIAKIKAVRSFVEPNAEQIARLEEYASQVHPTEQEMVPPYVDTVEPDHDRIDR